MVVFFSSLTNEAWQVGVSQAFNLITRDAEAGGSPWIWVSSTSDSKATLRNTPKNLQKKSNREPTEKQNQTKQRQNLLEDQSVELGSS